MIYRTFVDKVLGYSKIPQLLRVIDIYKEYRKDYQTSNLYNPRIDMPSKDKVLGYF